MDSPQDAEKIFIDEQELMLDGFRLGKQIYDSGFRPDFIVGIWRGGSAVGIVVQECLQYLGVETDHIAIRTSYRGMQNYPEMLRNSDRIRVHGLDYLEGRLDCEHRLLLVDDVFSSGNSVTAVKQKLHRKLRQNTPTDIRVAAAWYRPVKGRHGPDYHVNRTDHWLVLPYELSGLSVADIRRFKPWALPMVESVLQKGGVADDD